jgi:O-glycosyl hydrolase
VVFVAINTGTSPVEQGFTVTGGAMTAFTPYTTSLTKNCFEGTPYAVKSGSFTAVLEPSSITTFVSK